MTLILTLALVLTLKTQTMFKPWCYTGILNIHLMFGQRVFLRDVHQHGIIVSMVLFGSKCIILYIDQRAEVSLLYLISYINQWMLDLYIKQTYLLWKGLITNHKKCLLSKSSNMWLNCSFAVICKIRRWMSAVKFKLNPKGPCFQTEINT